MLAVLGRLHLDHGVAVVADLEHALGVVRDVARVARVGAGEDAVGEDDDAGVAARAHHHAAAQLALLEELEQGVGVDPGGVEVRVHGLGHGQLVEAVDQLAAQGDDVEDALAIGDRVVELDQRLGPQRQARIRTGVVRAFEGGAVLEQDQARRLFREQADVPGVALALEGRDQAREVDEGGLEGVVDDLARGDRDRLPTVLRRRPVLHAPMHLGRPALRGRSLGWRLLMNGFRGRGHLDDGLGLRLRFGFRLRLRRWFLMLLLRHRLGNRLRLRLRLVRGLRVRLRLGDQLGDRPAHRLVGRELGLGVVIELADRPAESLDHRVVAQRALADGVKQVAKQEIERAAATAAVANVERSRRALRLRGLQERPQIGVVERAG